jgi:dienelactone hydrolase
MRRAGLLVIAACATASPPAREPPRVVASGHPAAAISFEDDAALPADWRDDLTEVRGAALLHKGSYASARGGRVPAILVEPADAGGRRAGVVFVHWSQGNRSELLADAIALAAGGVCSVLLTAPAARPAAMRSPRVATDREQYVQAVVDVRRAYDLLIARGDVDPARLGYVGHSFGAHLGALVAAADDRPRVFVLAAGVASLTDYLRTAPVAALAEARASTPPADFARYLDSMAPLDARAYAARAHWTSVLLQYARDDELVPPPEADRYRAIAPASAELRWYDGGHELNDPRAAIDRRAWLLARLGQR